MTNNHTPTNTPTSPMDELEKEAARIIVEVTDKMMDIIGNPTVQPDQVHPKRFELCRNAHVELMQLINSRQQSILERAEIKSYDDGYEAGRNEKPPKLVDAVEFRREQYGWSKKKMADMLDMSRSHYSEFVHGKHGLPANSIRKAYAIGIPAAVLLQDDIDRQLHPPIKSNGDNNE